MEGKIVTGIDLVYLPRFKKVLKSGGETFLHRVFHEDELVNQELSHLAGIFAAKEAVMKALGVAVNSWLDIRVAYLPSGAPIIEISNFELRISNFGVSISHDGDYAVAQFVALIKT